jgi:hypothetical protein
MRHFQQPLIRITVIPWKCFILFAVLSPLLGCAERTVPFSLSVGTQSIGAKYKFTEDSLLVESANQIAALGSDTLKIAVTPKYVDDYMMEHDSEIDSILNLIKRKDCFLEVMDMPFRNIMLWVYPFSDHQSAFYKGSIPEDEAQAIYDEIYMFTSMLLKRYSGSGKYFFLGNWEGDWHVMRENYDYNADPAPEAITGAIEWFNLREKAVADARRDTPHEDVEVYYYIELNHVAKAMDDDRPAIVNRVLPHIRTDFVSWSSYDITKPAALMPYEQGRRRVLDALDYIEKHMPPSDVTGKRVFMGEYGFEVVNFRNPETQKNYTAAIMKWALEWGCPFVLYWELYCNEIDSKTGEHRGYWLIDETGEKQPIYHFHKSFLEKANAFVDAYKKEHGTLPKQKVFNQIAAEWIQPYTAFEIKADSDAVIRAAITHPHE